MMLLGCLVVASAAATALWNAAQIALGWATRTEPRHSPAEHAAAARHLTRAITAAAVAALVVSLPLIQTRLQLLTVLLGAL